MKDENAVALGRKGGQVTSDRKRAAIEENLRKARLKRWPNAQDDQSRAAPERTIVRDDY